MNDGQFLTIIKRCVEDLPEEFKEKLNNVSILIDDWPSSEQMKRVARRRRGSILLGLYEGIPQTKRRNYGVGGQLPDKITVFKFPLLRISPNYEKFVENIKDTVIHEIGHHFGMSEEALRKAKSGK